MTPVHLLGTSEGGRLSAFYSEGGSVILRDRAHKMWKFVLDEPATLGNLREVIGEDANYTPQEVLWLIDTLMCVETWLETCLHDLHRYGEVGVSF